MMVIPSYRKNMPEDTVWITGSVDKQLLLTFTRDLVPGLELGLLISKILTVYKCCFLNISFSTLKPLLNNECTVR
jgi:hypothetical protein